MTDIAQLADSLQPGPATKLVNGGGNLALLIRSDSRGKRIQAENADEDERLHAVSSNEKKLSHRWREQAWQASRTVS